MNYMNEKEQGCNGEQMQPEFERVLDSFRKSSAISFELSDRITYLSGRIKPIQAYETKEPSCDKINQEVGVVSDFYELLTQKNRLNNQLQIIVNHLQSLVG